MFRSVFLRMMFVVLSATLLGAVSGCAKDQRPAEKPESVPALGGVSDTLNLPLTEATLTIRGSLSYRERMALPPDARAIVELREGSIDGPVKAEKRLNLEGKQVPVPFELSVLRASLSDGQTYHLRGAIFTGGLPAWVSDAVAIDFSSGVPLDIGTMLMTRPAPGAYKSTMRCGDETVVVGFSKTAMLLTVGSETFEMKPTPSASGTKYEAVEDPTTTFWNKGENTTITVKGRTLPKCGRGNPAPAHEDTAATVPASPPTAGARVLAGAEWVVADIAGKKVIADSRVTLNFSADGKVFGKASCNNYTAQYTTSEDTISLSQPAATRMMCEKLMDQEKSFLDILTNAKRYEIAADGALVLHTADGRKLTARR